MAAIQSSDSDYICSGGSTGDSDVGERSQASQSATNNNTLELAEAVSKIVDTFGLLEQAIFN